MAYTDVGISSEDYGRLSGGWRKTAWRVKVKKPWAAVVPPADEEYIHKKITDQDVPGGFNIPRKVIHDDRTNRTFIFHYSIGANSTTNPVVTIVNHALPDTHERYREYIYQPNCEGWPEGSEGWGSDVMDMDYDPHNQTMVLAVGGGTPAQTPALFLIDCRDTIPEKVEGECGRLKDNPERFSCRVIVGNRAYVGAHSSEYLFVRFFKGRIYVWRYYDVSGSSYTPVRGFYALSYFEGYRAIGSGETVQLDVHDVFYLGHFTNGPGSDSGSTPTNQFLDPLPVEYTYPTMPSFQMVGSTYATRIDGFDCYWGDSQAWVAAVSDMRIESRSDGCDYVTLLTDPAQACEFGAQPMIAEICLQTCKKHVPALTPDGLAIDPSEVLFEAAGEVEGYYSEYGRRANLPNFEGANSEDNQQTELLELIVVEGKVTTSGNCTSAASFKLSAETGNGTVERTTHKSSAPA